MRDNKRLQARALGGIVEAPRLKHIRSVEMR